MKNYQFLLISVLLSLFFSCENTLDDKVPSKLNSNLNEKNLRLSEEKMVFKDTLELFGFLENNKKKNDFDSFKKSLETSKHSSLYSYYKEITEKDYEQMITNKSYLNDFRFKTSKVGKYNLIDYSIFDKYLQVILNKDSEVSINNQIYRFTSENIEIYDKNYKLQSKIKNKFKFERNRLSSQKAKVYNSSQNLDYSHNGRNYLIEFDSYGINLNFDQNGQINYANQSICLQHRKSFLGWYYLHDSDLMQINVNYGRSLWVSGTSTCGNSPQYGQGFGLYLPYCSNASTNIQNYSGYPCHFNINVEGVVKGKNNNFYYLYDSN